MGQEENIITHSRTKDVMVVARKPNLTIDPVCTAELGTIWVGPARKSAGLSRYPQRIRTPRGWDGRGQR